MKQDTYGQGFLDFTNAARRKGPATMNFGANKGDRDRLEKLGRTTNDRIDNAPAQTEHKAWNMRPRRKQEEIQPQIRFAANLQGQRLFESATKQTPLYFSQDQITG